MKKKKMTIKITSDITDAEGRLVYEWNGLSAVSWDSVAEQLAELPEGEGIELLINSRGGIVGEAWAIYDSLRATGREISAEVVGECSSAATIILLAAAKDARRSHPSATFLFHFPYVDGIWGPMYADDVQKVADQLTKSGERLLDLYVERTGVEREAMRELMAQDKSVSAEDALALGFISEIIAPLSAHKNRRKMSVMKAFKAFARALREYGLSLETADGKTLELVKESGEPQVGDEVLSDDGEYILPDGRVVVVEESVVTEVRPAEDKVEEPAEPEEVAADEPTEPEEVSDEERRLADLEATVEALAGEVAELEEQLAAAEANAKTDAEQQVLDAVKAAGGVGALKNVRSKGAAPKRTQKFTTKEAQGFAAYHAAAKSK